MMIFGQSLGLMRNRPKFKVQSEFVGNDQILKNIMKKKKQKLIYLNYVIIVEKIMH